MNAFNFVLIAMTTLLVVQDVVSTNNTLSNSSDLLEAKSAMVGRYYYDVSRLVTWYEAFILCKGLKMNLVSIFSRSENDEIETAIQALGYGARRFWTSGTDLAERKQFTWFSNGLPFNYTKWNTGEPTYDFHGVPENCVELIGARVDLTWNDAICTELHNFICEL